MFDRERKRGREREGEISLKLLGRLKNVTINLNRRNGQDREREKVYLNEIETNVEDCGRERETRLF